MADDRSVVIKIEGNSKALRDEFDRVKKQTKNLDDTLKSVAKGSTIAFAALATTIGLTVKSFAIYETGLIGVGKTADLTGKSLTDFGKDIQKLSIRLPFATKELLEIAQAAGQLGVKGKENLLKFTETIAKLGTASDLSGEEAATTLTRILNITREGTGDIDKFASVIVALGNSFAASEREIAAVTTRVARATTQFGVSSAEAAAFGAALKSVGIEAEGGGSAVGRSFQAIDEAIRGGGESFKQLQKITGLTGDALKKTFQDDAAVVFQKFVEGLSRAGETTKGVAATLADFGLAGTEILNVLPVLAKNSDELGRALRIAGTEVQNATALEKEFEAQSKTLDNETKKLSNTIGVISTQIGGFFTPAVKDATVATKDLLKEFVGLNENTKRLIAKVLAAATAFFGITAAIATLGIGVLALKVGFAGVALVIGGLAVPLGVVGTAFIGIGIAIAGITTNLESFRALLIGIQTLFTIAGQNFTVNVNKMKVGLNELIITLRKVQLAMFEALPASAYGTKVSQIKGSIALLMEANERLIQDNKSVKQSFEEIYDAIDAEKMRGKLEEEAAAALDARTIAAQEEADRKLVADGNKIIAEGETKARLQEQNISASNAVLALRELEIALLAALEKKGNIKEILTLKKKIADKKKLLTKDFTDTKKETFTHLAAIQKGELETATEILDFKKKTLKDTLTSAIASGRALFKEGSAAGKAFFLMQQGLAFASNIMNTQAAMALIGRQLGLAAPPFQAAELTAGILRGAVIAGTTISGLEDGGMVGGAGASRSGDRHRALLADGEIVAPRKNFEQVVEGTARQRGFVKEDESEGGGSVARIEISFTDDAAEFITARQLENTTLGTDRG